MTNAELIKALRNCKGAYPDASCDKCPHDLIPYCMADMHRDAADAIEKLGKEIVELEARISSLEYELAEAYCN